MGRSERRVSSGQPALTLAEVLEALAALLERTTDIDYARRPSAEGSGSIGAHVRHCVDHVRVVLDHRPGAVISFDHRRRGTTVERSRAVGIAALHECADDLHAAALAIDEPLQLEARLDAAGAEVSVTSSVGRELLYALQHTIHHNAVIALLLAWRGEDVPPRFGYAPSTPSPIGRLAAAECAR